MTKQVAFSNDAYAALRKEKREGESFSDLVLRLMRDARIATKDPMRFVNHPHQFWVTREEHLKMIEEGREVDRQRDRWAEAAARKAEGDPRPARAPSRDAAATET